MNSERFEHYTQFGSPDVMRLLWGTLAASVFFIALSLSIFVFLPSAESTQGAALLAAVPEEAAAEIPGEDAAADEAPAELAELPSVLGRQIEDALDSSSADAGLVLYRQPQTRAAVEWFYCQVTGSRETALAILDAAEEYEIAPSLAFALAHAESTYKTHATHVNKNGSVDRGLFQLNDKSFPYLSEDDFYNPKTSAHYGMAHLRFCLQSAGNEIAALAMYNAGTNKVQSNNTPQMTLNYISQITNYRISIEESFAREVLVFYQPGVNYADKMLAMY